MYDVDDVLPHYIACALWSSTDEADENGGESMDANYGPEDLADETRATMRREVLDFLELIERERPGVWEDMNGTIWAEPDGAGQVGHDFWLTRNHHGAGFWDRYYGDQPAVELGAFLTKWSDSMGSVDLYVGDDGKIYQM